MELGLRKCSLRTDYIHTFKLLSTREDREPPYTFHLFTPHTQKEKKITKQQQKNTPNKLLRHVFHLKITLHLLHYQMTTQ